MSEYQMELPMARRNDPWTSKLAGEHAAVRAGSYQARLLEAYRSHPEGLTDEEAGAAAGLGHVGYWKRCSDLRRKGLIEVTGETRESRAGEMQRVCRAREF